MTGNSTITTVHLGLLCHSAATLHLFQVACMSRNADAHSGPAVRLDRPPNPADSLGAVHRLLRLVLARWLPTHDGVGRLQLVEPLTLCPCKCQSALLNADLPACGRHCPWPLPPPVAHHRVAAHVRLHPLLLFLHRLCAQVGSVLLTYAALHLVQLPVHGLGGF